MVLLSLQLIQKLDNSHSSKREEKQRSSSRSHVNRVIEFSSAWLVKNQKESKSKPRKSSSNEDHLRHSDWAILEDHLRSQLAFLNKDDEIKAKVITYVNLFLYQDICSNFIKTVYCFQRWNFWFKTSKTNIRF